MKKLNWNSPTDLPSIPTDRCVLHTPPAWTTQWVLDGPSCPLDCFGCGFERHDLVRYSAKGYSQYGADGVIGKLFHDLGTTDKYYVEFGTQKDATECNTRRLRETCAWSGLLMDGGNANATINLHTAFITRENIGVLFKRHKVPKHFDLLSVDIDGNDYHVLSAILRAGYRPRVVVVEYNAQLGPEKDLVAKYSPTHRWDMSCYISASITAFYKLARLNGYSIVASMLPDLYWVRDDVLAGRSYEFADDLATLRAQANYGLNSSHPVLAARAVICTKIFEQRGFERSTDLLKNSSRRRDASIAAAEHSHSRQKR